MRHKMQPRFLFYFFISTLLAGCISLPKSAFKHPEAFNDATITLISTGEDNGLLSQLEVILLKNNLQLISRSTIRVGTEEIFKNTTADAQKNVGGGQIIAKVKVDDKIDAKAVADSQVYSKSIQSSESLQQKSQVQIFKSDLVGKLDFDKNPQSSKLSNISFLIYKTYTGDYVSSIFIKGPVTSSLAAEIINHEISNRSNPENKLNYFDALMLSLKSLVSADNF